VKIAIRVRKLKLVKKMKKVKKVKIMKRVIRALNGKKVIKVKILKIEIKEEGMSDQSYKIIRRTRRSMMKNFFMLFYDN
jgi:hypothetical protein